ncbi:CHASE domain-containing protein, partial [Candidatus Falkowbacteria bacterium]|nr:CHASE domain-containing protein [Candidatus Falkowbacteria bacterium]
AFGFDLFSNSSRRAGLEEARDTNKPVATAPIRLVQEKGEQMGFLVFLPVYKNNASIETVGEKREALIGYISAVFRAGDLLTEFLNVFPESKSVHLEVVDTRAQKEGETDYSVFNQYTPENYAHEFTAERSITVGGREWMLSFHELPGFSALVGAERYVPTAVVVAGVLFSLLLFLILYSFSTSRDRALSLAKSMTTEINKSKNDMKKVLQEAKESKAESEEMNDAMVGREMRMIELKEEIAKLKSKE